MECFLDWGDGNQGNRNTFSFEFTIDNEKPVILDTYVRNDGDDKIVEFNVYDNHYLQGYIVYTYEDLDENGNPTGLTSVTNGVIPVYNGEFNSSTRISLDVTAYWSLIEKNGGKTVRPVHGLRQELHDRLRHVGKVRRREHHHYA